MASKTQNPDIQIVGLQLTDGSQMELARSPEYLPDIYA